ncbi:MAG: TIGR00730 family Rossman fold protein [Candidatus Hydrogenedentes bacterium]|nr:TIGR00730 family Rossman fold protein [Candidatus Hydrogenedentota bacterium]
MRSICIFAGSSDFAIDTYKEEVEKLAEYLVSKGVDIVYGAGRVGLMGVLSRKVHSLGGKLIGVVPGYFNTWRLVFDACNELIVTRDLQERKSVMAGRADGFLVLPGGIGTLDEFAEVLAWKQAHQHQKPIFLMNLYSFYDPLISLFENMLKKNFVLSSHMSLFKVFNSTDEFIVFSEREIFAKDQVSR